MDHKQRNLEGKTAVVTGAAQGIGLAIAKALESAGAQVIGIDRNTSGFSELEDNPNIHPLQGDITDKALPAAIDEALKKRDLVLDILVNNAGVIGSGGHALIADEEDFQQVFGVNVFALFRLSRWAIDHMMRVGGGSIVNVSSIFGVVGAEGCPVYSSSKSAVVGLTNQMATDFGPNNIRVNAVAPGLIETPIAKELLKDPWRQQILVDQSPLRRLGQPIDVARAVRFLVSEEASFITGQTLQVDGGWAVGRYPVKQKIEL